MAQTTEQILAAASALESRGERVSIRSVRAELGGGDPGTIGRILKQRREGTGTTTTEKTVSLPDTITRTLNEWAKQLVAAQTENIRVELATAHEDNEALLAQMEALQGQMEALQNELDMMRRERDTTAGALAAVQKQVESQAAELAQERAQAITLREQVAAAKATAAAAEARLDEIRATRKPATTREKREKQ